MRKDMGVSEVEAMTPPGPFMLGLLWKGQMNTLMKFATGLLAKP